MAEQTPVKIALWGHGMFGKRTSESMKRFWGGAYAVTRIYDIEKRGRDPWWELEVSAPDNISADFHAGVFEKVLICIHDRITRNKVKKNLDKIGVPWFFPGKKEDIVPAGQLEKSAEDPLCVREDGYSLFCLKNMRGAVSDHDRGELIHLFDEEGRIPEESVRKYRSWEADRALMPPFRLKHAIPERVKLEGPYCVLAEVYSMNYWHFTFQCADRVALLEDAGYRGKYIIAGRPSNLALMHLLGVGDDRIVKCEDLENHKVYEFEELVLLSFNGHNHDHSLEAVARVAERVKKQLVRRDDAPKKLYVKRIGARKLVNGDEAAKSLGFEIYVPEEHSVKEQMEAFYNADVVLTSHGANSTNCIYMRKGAVFAEVFSSAWSNCINRDICEYQGIHYLSETGEPVIEPTDHEEAIFTDFAVGEEKIKRMVKRAEDLLCLKE